MAELTSGRDKIMATEGIGPSGGLVVYWNGNSTIYDWSDLSEGTQPDIQNLFKNTVNYICDF